MKRSKKSAPPNLGTGRERADHTPKKKGGGPILALPYLKGTDDALTLKEKGKGLAVDVLGGK